MTAIPTKTELPLASFYSRKRPKEYRDTEARVAKLLAAVDARLGGVVAAANKTKKKGEKGEGEEAEEESPHLGFRVFRRQAEAFAAADSAGPAAALRVFSVELGGGNSGSGRKATWRAYVAAALPAFWARYRALRPSDRHHYEILREGRPCHLYLDLEFKRGLNPGVDGDAVVDGAVAAVRRVLARRWPDCEEVSRFDDADVLELDSSSAEKFSRHVTLRLRGFAFATNADAGAVVREAVYEVGDGGEGEEGGGEEGEEGGGEERVSEGEEGKGEGNADEGESDVASAPPPPPPPPPSLAAFARVVVSDQGPRAEGSAVDLGVYTRNRAWRMALSSKVDAPARVLRPLARRYGGVVAVAGGGAGAGVGAGGENPAARVSDRAAFFCGLAGDVPPGFKLLSIEGAVYGGGGGPPGRRSSCSSSSSAFAGGVGGAAVALSSSSSSSLRARPGPSPFPAVDAFIEEVATRLTGDGRQATVRSWAVAEGEGGQQQQQQQSSSNLCPDPNPATTTTTLVLSLRDGRFCGGVGRPHRSNGVYYVVDLRGGTFRQRCHDPECRGYRSPAAPLPGDVARAAALFALSLCASPSSLFPFPSSGDGGAGFEGIDGDEAATRRFLAALDAAEAVALEERGETAATRRRGEESCKLFEDGNDGDGDGGDGGEGDDQEALFAAVDAAVAEAAAKRNTAIDH